MHFLGTAAVVCLRLHSCPQRKRGHRGSVGAPWEKAAILTVGRPGACAIAALCVTDISTGSLWWPNSGDSSLWVEDTMKGIA